MDYLGEALWLSRNKRIMTTAGFRGIWNLYFGFLSREKSQSYICPLIRQTTGVD